MSASAEEKEMPRTPVLAAIILAVLAVILVIGVVSRDGPSVGQQSGNPHAIQQD
jgi:hypothetical protein